VTATTLS